MITTEKVFILTFPGNGANKEKLFAERLRLLPLPENTPLEVVEVPREIDALTALKAAGMKLMEGYHPDEKRDVSLAIGHWRVWQQALQERRQSVVVLEEDFLPTGTHYHILNTAETSDLLYLGRYASDGDRPTDTGGLVRPGYSQGAYAYRLDQRALETLTASGFAQKVIPAGELFSALSGQHPDREVKEAYTGRLEVLAPMKNFISPDGNWHASLQAAGGYIPLHPQLYQAFGEHEAAWVKRYVNPQLVHREFDLICDEPIDNVYAFPFFTPTFCQEIIEEAEHFGEWTNYREKDGDPIDIKLSSFGLDEVFNHALRKYLHPLLFHKYQLHGQGWESLTSQNFIVRYLAERQGHLGLHNDGSYVSLIVTLNLDYDGGGTFFPKYKKLIKPEQVGYASVHPGLLGYLHGARPITRGRRYILASFFFLGSRPFADGTY